MKIIFTTFCTLLCFVFVLIFPVFLSFYNTVVGSHHGMNSSDCVEHCSSFELPLHASKVSSFSEHSDFSESVISYALLFVVPLAFFYVFVIYMPPNIGRNIQNYDYGSLIGIIKLTT